MIIPTLNEADQLTATLDSVIAALGGSAQIVVVDGGSDDRTREIAAARAHVVLAPAGRGRQLNAGARAASGDVLLFLHADTRLSSAAGASLADTLRRTDVVGGCFALALRGPSARRRIAIWLGKAISARSRWFKTATGDQAIFARRAAFERIGGFGSYDLFEDVIFYRQLRRLGRVVVLEPAVSTSDRRWEELGYVRTIATHLLLRLLFTVGVSPAQLARLYRRGRPSRKSARSRSAR